MGFLSKLKTAASTVGRAIVKGAIKAAECTLELCEDIATLTADGCRWAREKINKWTSSTPPKDPVPPIVIAADTPLIDNSIDTIKEDFPNGVINSAKNSNEEDRKNMIVELVPKTAQAMGIKNPPEVIFFVPDSIEQIHSLCGGYSRQDNTLKLNLAMIVSNEPELFREQVSTIFHELVHARQYEAVMAWANDKPCEEYGYSTEYLQLIAYNMLNYIGPDENYEAYTKQPIEAEAFWFEEQIKPHFN